MNVYIQTRTFECVCVRACVHVRSGAKSVIQNFIKRRKQPEPATSLHSVQVLKKSHSSSEYSFLNNDFLIDLFKILEVLFFFKLLCMQECICLEIFFLEFQFIQKYFVFFCDFCLQFLFIILSSFEFFSFRLRKILALFTEQYSAKEKSLIKKICQ